MSRKVFLALSLIALMAGIAATFAQEKPKRIYTKNDFINIDGGNLNDRIERAFKQFKSSGQGNQDNSVWLAYHFPAREGSYIGPFTAIDARSVPPAVYDTPDRHWKHRPMRDDDQRWNSRGRRSG